MGILDLIFGKCVLTTRQRNAAKLLNVCMNFGIEYSKPKFTEESFSICCTFLGYKRLKETCAERGIELECVFYSGLPKLFSKYRKRVGLAVGGILGAFLMVLALNTVWRVDLVGNVNLSRESVENLLLENGFSVGSFIPTADLTAIENAVMNSCPDIAWISLNLNGTVARVEIREAKKGCEKSQSPAHLVASRDGKIERIEAYNGNCLIKVGDVVRVGEILVSGIYENEQGSYRVARADGDIFARTVREFCVEIPFESTQKVYTGRKFSEIYINFFKKSIKVFVNTGNLPPSCDIIYENGRLRLGDLPSLPVGVEKTCYLEYETIPVRLSEEQAMKQAFAALEAELGELSEDIELLEKNIDFEITDSSYILKCTLVCIENIASVSEITVKQ